MVRVLVMPVMLVVVVPRSVIAMLLLLRPESGACMRLGELLPNMLL